jgi:hypothetical protein
LNQPIQELASASFTGVDIINTNSGYLAVFGQNNSVNGTGSKLFAVDSFMKNGIARSCNDLMQIDNNK